MDARAMVDEDEERCICRWCTEWETIQSPNIQECLSCGGYGPGGYECAFCWTRDHTMVEGDEPKTVISGLKYYLKNRLVHRNDSHMKYAWYAYTRYIIMLALEEENLVDGDSRKRSRRPTDQIRYLY
jgi:hypothetical protein